MLGLSHSAALLFLHYRERAVLCGLMLMSGGGAGHRRLWSVLAMAEERVCLAASRVQETISQ